LVILICSKKWFQKCIFKNGFFAVGEDANSGIRLLLARTPKWFIFAIGEDANSGILL